MKLAFFANDSKAYLNKKTMPIKVFSLDSCRYSNTLICNSVYLKAIRQNNVMLLILITSLNKALTCISSHSFTDKEWHRR